MPVRTINHGPTVSMYYKDPDGNQVELQVDVFDKAGAASYFNTEAVHQQSDRRAVRRRQDARRLRGRRAGSGPAAPALSVTSLTLYFGPGASSMAVHIALHEIGVPFEAQAGVASAGRRHRTPAFLALNPAGKVPTLLVDGTPLTEVAGCPAAASSLDRAHQRGPMILIWRGYASDQQDVRHPMLILVILSAAISPSDQTRAAWLAPGPLRNRVCCGAPSRPRGASPPAPFYPSLVNASASCTRSCSVAVVGFVSSPRASSAGTGRAHSALSIASPRRDIARPSSDPRRGGHEKSPASWAHGAPDP